MGEKMRTRTRHIEWATYYTTPTALQVCFHPGTAWFPATELAKTRAMLELACAGPNLECRPAVQLCDDIEGTYVTKSAVGGVGDVLISGDGVYFPTDGYADVQPDADKKQYARLGMETRLKSGETEPNWARVALSFDVIPPC